MCLAAWPPAIDSDKVIMRTTASSFASVALILAVLAPLQAQRNSQPACHPQNAAITVPQGFCVAIFADSVGPARHLVVAPNGDVFVAIGNAGRSGQRGGVLALRDTNGDGKADQRERFGENGGNGIALRGTQLFFAPDNAVLRYNLPSGQLTATGAPDTLVRELPAVRSHTAKSIALGRGNELYVNIGSPSNVCSNGPTGQDPCPELEMRAGIWLFDTAKLNQRQSDGTRFATGLRNIVALMYGADGQLYGAQHGRDNLFQGFPQYFSQKDGAEKPAEIFARIERGDDYGWPYCFYDQDQQKQILAPEYGGDGKQTGRCAEKDVPLVAFPGHWAPNGVLFYSGQQFPAKYRGGLFVAFHGSWNRAPEPQAGYNVTFVPFANGRPSAGYEVFANGFAGQPTIVNPRDAVHRPVGLAQAPDGSLYVTDDVGGRIYRIFYTGR